MTQDVRAHIVQFIERGPQHVLVAETAIGNLPFLPRVGEIVLIAGSMWVVREISYLLGEQPKGYAPESDMGEVSIMVLVE